MDPFYKIAPRFATTTACRQAGRGLKTQKPTLYVGLRDGGDARIQTEVRKTISNSGYKLRRPKYVLRIYRSPSCTK